MLFNFGKIAADFAKAAVQHQAHQQAQAKRAGRPVAECTPCAANAYIQQARKDLGHNKRGRR